MAASRPLLTGDTLCPGLIVIDEWDFGLGETFQPDEHLLQLKVSHPGELHRPSRLWVILHRSEGFADFLIQPASEPFPPADR
jgi:hypothetical protein